MRTEDALIADLWSALAPDREAAPVELVGSGTLESAFAVSEFATASVAAAGLALARLESALTDTLPTVTVDRALACGWFRSALTPLDWTLPSPWDALAGDYETEDGWIRLHTNAPHHRAAALGVLGVDPEVAPDRAAVAALVARWKGNELEDAVVASRGCAAVMRDVTAWLRHPQGSAVRAEPLIAWSPGEDADDIRSEWRPVPGRPLAGLRVLDLTRVIAGPVATRLLAGLGADVLRVDSPEWDEPAIVPEMTLGKRAARLDARTPEGLARLRDLVAASDVVVHGYRADALERLGLGDDVIAGLRPGIVDVGLDAYGWSGPWRDRRGFDSLVQMSAGIAEEGMRWLGTAQPQPLPVQALDHATGYLAAAAVIEGLARRVDGGHGSSARLSLARTGLELVAAGRGLAAEPAPTLIGSIIHTPWGSAELLDPPLTVGETTPHWERPPRALGSDPAAW